MDPFEYLTVLFSIVVGLAIARPLEAFVQIVQKRETVRIHWLPLIWTAAILQWTIFFWWFSFSLSGIEEWHMGRLTLVFAYAAVLFFLLGLLYPREVEDGFDHQAHFESHRPWFFGALFCAGSLDVADTLVKLSSGVGGPGSDGIPFWATHVTLWLIGSVIGMRSDNPKLLGSFGVIFLFFSLMASYFGPAPGS